MTQIYLIRHGQASFGEQDYDQLSTKGIAQAKLLGEYWRSLARNKSSDGVKDNTQYFCGSLLRHAQTAEHFFGEPSAKAPTIPQAQPRMITHAGFNELDHVDVLSRYNEKWQSFQAMQDDIIELNRQKISADALKKHEGEQFFKTAFSQAIARWVSGDFDDYHESWLQFKERCIQSLNDVVMQQSRSSSNNTTGAEQVIFTSGGVIGVIVGHILQVNDQDALKISQQLVNSSVTKITVTNDGFRLNYLNNYSHLELAGQEWISHF